MRQESNVQNILSYDTQCRGSSMNIGAPDTTTSTAFQTPLFCATIQAADSSSTTSYIPHLDQGDINFLRKKITTSLHTRTPYMTNSERRYLRVMRCHRTTPQPGTHGDQTQLHTYTVGLETCGFSHGKCWETAQSIISPKTCIKTDIT